MERYRYIITIQPQLVAGLGLLVSAYYRGGYCKGSIFKAFGDFVSLLKGGDVNAERKEITNTDTINAVRVTDTNVYGLRKELGIQKNWQGRICRRTFRYYIDNKWLEQYRYTANRIATIKHKTYKTSEQNRRYVHGHCHNWSCKTLLPLCDNERKQLRIIKFIHSAVTSERGWAVC